MWGPDYSIKTAAERILWVKMLNAGQICTNIDYVFLPKGKEIEFVDHCKRLIAVRYPDLNGPDYTSIIDDRSFERLHTALEDARAKGATIINLAEGKSGSEATQIPAVSGVVNPTEDMELMRREIFGTILPVRAYSDRQEVADYINGHDRPLEIYPFTNNRELRDYYISRVMSGGVSVNEALLHARFALRRRWGKRHGAKNRRPPILGKSPQSPRRFRDGAREMLE